MKNPDFNLYLSLSTLLSFGYEPHKGLKESYGCEQVSLSFSKKGTVMHPDMWKHEREKANPENKTTPLQSLAIKGSGVPYGCRGVPIWKSKKLIVFLFSFNCLVGFEFLAVRDGV